MKDQGLSGGFPFVTVALLVLAALFYTGLLANIAGARGSDAAGRGMAMGFAAIAGLGLWIVLAVLFAIAIVNGRMPAYAAASAIVLVPLSAIAAAVAAGLRGDDHGNWLIAAPVLLPPLLALYALWARFPVWHMTLPPGSTTTVLGGAIVVLTAAPLVLAAREFMPNPARDAARAAQVRAQEEAEQKRQQEVLAELAARFGRLGPDSSLADYLEYLPPGHSRFEEAVAGARLVKNRNADAAALLRQGAIGDLADLWRLDVDPAAVCQEYGTALEAEAGKITRTRSDHITVAINLERQLPNIQWLTGAGCDLSKALVEAEAKVRAVSDSPRLDKFADALAAGAQRR